VVAHGWRRDDGGRQRHRPAGRGSLGGRFDGGGLGINHGNLAPQDRLEPLEDGRPLGEVGRHLRRGQVEQTEALFDTPHIRLGFAQRAKVGQLVRFGPGLHHLGGLGAGVEAHADGRHLATAAGHTGQGHQFRVAIGRRFAVEDRVADGHQDDVGITDHAGQVESAQPTRGVEDDMGGAHR
jgi:hypothetical protein